MGLDWLFGAEERHPNAWLLRSRTLDIDVVGDVHRMLTDQWTAEMVDLESQATPVSLDAQQRDDHARMLDNQLAEARARQPAIYLIAPDPSGLPLYDPPNAPTVALGEVPNLGAHDRGRIVLRGASLTVDFRRTMPPRISSRLIDGDYTGQIRPIAELIEHSGRPRARWKFLRRLLPYAAAVAITLLGAWMLVAERPPLPTTLFVSTIVIVIWVGAVVAARYLRNRYVRAWPGHRFREVSRAALRDRLTNARATIIVSVIVSVITIPSTALVTWIVTMVFGG